MKVWVGNVLVAIAFLGLPATAIIGKADLDFPSKAFALVVTVIATGSIGMLGRRIAMTGRKERAARSAAAIVADPRPPVVYFRGFADDALLEDTNVVEGFIQLTTEEEQYAMVLSRIGPFVAIGDPRERLPDLGAARIYVGDGNWREVVEALLDRARLVVLRLSSSEGLLWELRTVIARNDPGKLLLLIPGPPDQYPAMREFANKSLPKPLPASLPRGGSFKKMSTIASIARFGLDWTPELLPIRVNYMRGSLRAPLAPHLQLTLRPVFEHLGAPWKKPSLSIFALIMVMIFIAVLAIFAGLLIRDFGL